VDDADRVVVVLRGLALEEGVTALGLDEPESEGLRDRWRRDLPRRHEPHELEPRSLCHHVPERERVLPAVGPCALDHRPTA
jgi:hypothetical protein